MYLSFIIHLSAGRHLGWILVLAIVNCTTVNLRLQVPLSYTEFIFPGYIPGNGMARLYGRSASNSLLNVCLLNRRITSNEQIKGHFTMKL